MFSKKILLFLIGCACANGALKAQTQKLQQGIFCKAGSNVRLGRVQVFNKHSAATTRSNLYGVFSIPAQAGDTLLISCEGYNNATFTVTDFADNICYLKPAITLPEVVIKETSVKADLDEVKKGYRRKSVFYTGTPHYYYLLLKPMTFIYENFKSEVINARKFNRYAKKELGYYEIAGRFNDLNIKNTIPIQDEELDEFKSDYWPSLKQIRTWNDYDLSEYIIRSYQDFKKGIAPETKMQINQSEISDHFD